MDRQQTINVIHDYLAGQPVVKAWIFGSFARGEEKAQSDIDILFIPDFEHGSFTLLTHGGMYEDLKQLWGGVKSIWWLTALCDRMPRRVWNGTKYWSMREPVRDKGRLEDIVEYSSNVLKIIDGIEFEEFCLKQISLFRHDEKCGDRW